MAERLSGSGEVVHPAGADLVGAGVEPARHVPADRLEPRQS